MYFITKCASSCSVQPGPTQLGSVAFLHRLLLYLLLTWSLAILSALSPASAIAFSQPAAAAAQRCHISTMWRQCKESYGAKDLFDEGYNFGWQPFHQLRSMCRNRTHVKSLKCLQDEAAHQCTDRRDFTHIMILTVYNYELYARAADYICEEHNIGIFEQHADCLSHFLNDAQYCSRFKSAPATIKAASVKIGKAINNTKQNTQTIRTDMEAFLNFIRRTVQEQLCSDRKQFLDCIERQLLRDRRRCSNPIVMLVVKYYSQLMPDWCRRRFNEPPADLMADQRTPPQRAAAIGDTTPRHVGAPPPAYSASAGDVGNGGCHKNGFYHVAFLYSLLCALGQTLVRRLR